MALYLAVWLESRLEDYPLRLLFLKFQYPYTPIHAENCDYGGLLELKKLTANFFI